MLKNLKAKINEKGSILIEAMAMLGLIAMVTPILYKKAAERTTEIRDINAASEMRGLIKAVDDYLKDNYELIIKGQTITIQSGLTRPENESFSWSDFYNTSPGLSEKYLEVPIEHFAEYLPYGFLDEKGDAIGSRTFRSYKVAVKKVDTGVAGGDTVRKQVLTGFVLGIPTEPEFPMLRASRVASMIGSNGGYAIKDNEVSGSQGIWGIENVSNDLGLSGVKKGDILTASIQSISSGAGDYEGVLYRVPRANRDLNTMSTTLWMGNNTVSGANQMIINSRGKDFEDQTTDQADALLLFNEGDLKPGARIEGRLAAAVTGMKIINAADNVIDTKDIREQFLVDEDSNTSVDATFKAALLEKGTNDEGNVDRSKDSYNLAVEKENVKVENERMNVGDAIQVFPVKPGTKSDKEEKDNPGTLNDETRIKLVAESGLIVESKLPGGEYAGNTELDVNSKGVVAVTDGSVNLITGEKAGDQDASLQLGGTNVDGEVGAGVGELYAVDQLSMGTVRDVETNDDPTGRFINRIPEGTAQLLMSEGESKLESDFVDIITTNYADNTGSLIALQESLRAPNYDEIYAHSDYIHLHAREELHLETDKDLRLTADNIYNEFEGSATPGAGGSGVYTISVTDPRDGSGNPATIRYQTMYMDEGVTRMANTEEIVLQSDEVNIGNFGKSNNLDDYNPVVSIKGDKDSLEQYGKNGELINIRRGVIEMERNPGYDKNDPRSYIKADRLVSPESLDGAIPTKAQSGTPYDEYQVNPAYTSVMHDIKLTSRGGARLSDILPDFINKGIYVVDTTYREQIGNWEDFNVDSSGHINMDSQQAQKHQRSEPVSPWTGFVPKPQCPPGYARVATVIPAGIAMAQAGVPSSKPNALDLDYPTDIIRDPFEFYSAENGYGMDPLFFQKNTWFRAKAYPHYKGNAASPENFQGWSVILGFIYPYEYFKDYFHKMSGLRPDLPMGNMDEYTVIWNLFPVYRKELEAYATVYCYFDRLSANYDGKYVDKYDQLGKYRFDDEKDSAYQERLNDPTLKYTDPW